MGKTITNSRAGALVRTIKPTIRKGRVPITLGGYKMINPNNKPHCINNVKQINNKNNPNFAGVKSHRLLHCRQPHHIEGEDYDVDSSMPHVDNDKCRPIHQSHLLFNSNYKNKIFSNDTNR